MLRNERDEALQNVGKLWENNTPHGGRITQPTQHAALCFISNLCTEKSAPEPVSVLCLIH